MLDKPAYAIALKLAKTLFYGKFMHFFSDEFTTISALGIGLCWGLETAGLRGFICEIYG